MNNKKITKEIDFHGRKLVLETGELALQANMSVKASYGDTVVLVTAVSGDAKPDIDFFPLTVNYEEKLYASGYIKTSRFIKRDGRATDDATVTKRLIDHAIRPLFPKDFMDEVQVIATILSLEEDADPEFLAMTAASACLTASNIPWQGPMVSLKVGYANGEYTINPSKAFMEEHSELDMMISFCGEDKKFVAVEAEVQILPEEKVMGAIEFAYNNADPIVKLINDFAKEVNPEGKKYAYVSKALSADLVKEVTALVGDQVKDLVQATTLTVQEFHTKHAAILEEVTTKTEGKYKKVDLVRAIDEVEKHALQHLILDEGKRPDGRGVKEVRSINTSIDILPRTHGSAVFSRGVTQVLTVATLGSPSLELFIQNMYGEKTKRFIHYYNFPPFSTGETGKMGSPGSREIGHGMLAERGLRPVVPDQKDFPYMIILVSETMASSGSSSMASTCAGSMALMDAGVPIKEMVAGIAIGLMVNDDQSKHLIMTDLAYREDAFGYLDFKMTGTRTGVTALQSDMKLAGIPVAWLPKIIDQSREARMHILDEMEKTIKEPKKEVSKYAPKTSSMKIDPTKIGIVIGSGGRTIKEIQEKTDALLTIEEDGTVIVSASDEDKVKKALELVDGLTRDIKPGEIYEGVVEEIVDFGAFVEILPGKTGLLHVSELAHAFVRNVEDVIHVGDTVKVKVLAVNEGKISLSKKALEDNPNPDAFGSDDGRPSYDSRPPRDGGRPHRDGGRPQRSGGGRFPRERGGHRS